MHNLRGKSKPFGSTLILLAGDFRQTLPIIPRSTAADEMNACLKNSNLLAHVKILKLTTNMRGRLQSDDSDQRYSDQLLAIRNGKLPVDSISERIQISKKSKKLHKTQKSRNKVKLSSKRKTTTNHHQ